jgi:galactokinase
MIESALKQEFLEKFGEEPVVIKSPGRINIIGEHTDYNDGFVLPAAIDKAAYLAVSVRQDDSFHLIAQDLNEEYNVNLADLKPLIDGGWSNYLLGVVAQFIKKGVEVKGLNMMLSSNVPIGAGLSSSAAVECATAMALNELFKTGYDKIELVKMAQKAEHEYAGVMCGIMDQFASMMGKKDHLIKLDCRSLEYEYVPLKMEGLRIVLLNTNVHHSLATSAYNTRRNECKQAVEWVKEGEPTVQALRDVNEAMLDKYVLHKDALIDKRSRFIVREIERLQLGCIDLFEGNIEALGKKMFATHDGLSHDYDVSCPELDFLVDAVRNNPAVVGSRMMGGGFGGCTINLVKEEAIDDLIASMKPLYEEKMNLPLTAYIATIENGTEMIG